ncbi:hypothetical protein HY489_02130 [Candidatus Woesearchaeota archaeon]|nr:hypothetical protein [Candidatus Woesearchaeota archaeon]
MKTVDVTFKKIEITDFYSQLDQVKVRILFNDGKDKALEKQVTIKEPATLVSAWLAEIRTKLKEQHKTSSLDDSPLANAVVLRFAQEADVLEERMTRFLAQAREKIHSGKLAKLSYWDLDKKIKGFTTTL